MRFFILIALFFIVKVDSCGDLFAQIKYRNGFIITTSRDTIKGEVGFQKFEQLYTQCYFKVNNSRKIIAYSIYDIYGFGIEKELAFLSPIALFKTTAAQNSFAQLLVSGKISLIKSNSEYYLLIDSQVIHLNEKYKDTLGELMKDCKALEYDILLSNKDDAKLSELVTYYNSYKGGEPRKYVQELPKFVISPAISFGVVHSQLLSNISNKIDKKKSNSNARSLQGGINADIIFPRFKNEISINTGLFYFSTIYHVDYSLEIPLRSYSKSTQTMFEEIDVSYSSIQIPIIIKYNIRSKYGNFYIGGGVSNHIIFSNSYHNIIETIEENVVQTNPFENPIHIKNTQQGLLISLGIDHTIFKRMNLGIDIKAEFGNGIYKSNNGIYSIDSGTRNFYASTYIRF